jgi:glycosyltransferase involved in cell wall biosynthesis
MSISLCCIVKNEQSLIADMLISVSNLVDETIVVDTGSTDNTLEIAASLGSKIFKFSWIDDFAAARNFSLSHAKSDWILVLDADERLAEQEIERLRAISSMNAWEAYFLRRLHYQKSSNFPFFEYIPENHRLGALGAKGFFSTNDLRFFKNKPGIQFQGAVHESIEDSIRSHSEYKIIYSDMVIDHVGTLLEPGRVEQKNILYLDLAKKKAECNPTDWRNWFQLGVEHQNSEKFTEAIECFSKATELLPSSAESWRQLGICLLAQNEYRQSLESLRKSVEIDSTNSLAWNALGICLRELNLISESGICFETALQIEPTNQIFKVNLRSLEGK